MLRTLPLLTAIIVLVATGAAQRIWSQRSTGSRDLDAAVVRLDKVAANIGDWESHSFELDHRQIESARIAGHIARRYKNRRDGSVASILLVCGRPGPISVHTPEICYAGVGYELEKAPSRYTAEWGSPPRTAGFSFGDFRKRGTAIPHHLRIYWSLNASTGWEVPENPRLSFAGSDFLYKLYVISESPGSFKAAGSDSGAALMQALLPELDRALSPVRPAAAPGVS